MKCFQICFGHFPFRVCYRICIPDLILAWPWRIGPDPEMGALTIDGRNPEWLQDIHGLALASRAAELATGETAKILGEAVARAKAHVERGLPEGVTLSEHEHAAA